MPASMSRAFTARQRVAGGPRGTRERATFHRDYPAPQLLQLIGAEGGSYLGENRLFLAGEVALDLEQQRAPTLGQVEAVGREAAHLGEHLVQLLVFTHPAGDGVVVRHRERGVEGREHDFLLRSLMRGELLEKSAPRTSDEKDRARIAGLSPLPAATAYLPPDPRMERFLPARGDPFEPCGQSGGICDGRSPSAMRRCR